MAEKKFFAKGKRGYIYLVKEKGKIFAIKEKNPSSDAVGRILNEGQMLERVNKKGIGPKLVSYDERSVRYEFVEGKTISEWLPAAKQKDIIKVIVDVAGQCVKLDEIGITKEEMTRPVKHIIISKKGPVMIDFERSHFVTKPGNLTQFVQFLTSTNMTAILRGKGIFISIDAMRKEAAKYKSGKGSVKRILSHVHSKTPFETKVLLEVSKIPKGQVASYSDIAKKIRTKALRAVGTAIRKNPCAPEIPCHRVIKADGSLGKYSGKGSKEAMLRKEGIKIV